MSDRDLTDFLLARIAEDECRAEKWLTECAAVQFEEYGDTIVLDGSPWVRVLAECEAKRRIVEEVAPHLDDVEGHAIDGGMYDDDRPHALRDLLRLLAQPYADHPDFNPEWRA